MTTNPHTDPTDERLDEILLQLLASLVKHWADGEKDVVSLERDAKPAKAALLKWRDDHTERKVREARIDEVNRATKSLNKMIDNRYFVTEGLGKRMKSALRLRLFKLKKILLIVGKE